MFSEICIQETWLRHDQDTSLFEIPGYNLIHKVKVVVIMEVWSYIWKKNLHTTIESYIINLIYGKVFSLMFSTNK